MQDFARALHRALPLVLNHASVANQVMNVNNLIRHCSFGPTLFYTFMHILVAQGTLMHTACTLRLNVTVHPVMFALCAVVIMDTKGALVRLHAVIVSCIARAHIEVLGTTF